MGENFTGQSSTPRTTNSVRNVVDIDQSPSDEYIEDEAMNGGSSCVDAAVSDASISPCTEERDSLSALTSPNDVHHKNTIVSKTHLCVGVLDSPEVVYGADGVSHSPSRRRRSSVLARTFASELSWYQGCEAIRKVRDTGSVTGEEYKVINNCIWMISAVVHFTIFTALFAITYWNTAFFGTTSEKTIAITCIAISWAICTIEICITGIYCLTKMVHPLVRTRGTLYIGMTSLGLFGAASFLSIIALNYIRVVRTSIDVSLIFRVIMTSFAILVIGAQAAKQRLLYLLFEVRAHPSPLINKQSYFVVVLWIGIIAGLLLYFGLPNMMEHMFLLDVIMNLGFDMMLMVVVYYTYMSRNVTLAFSDLRSNVMVAGMMVLVTTVVFILSNTVFKMSGQPSMQNPPDLGSCFITVFAFHGVVCLSTTMLFAQLGLIAYFKLEVAKTLNPATTFIHSNTVSQIACSIGGATIPTNPGARTLNSASRISYHV